MIAFGTSRDFTVLDGSRIENGERVPSSNQQTTENGELEETASSVSPSKPGSKAFFFFFGGGEATWAKIKASSPVNQTAQEASSSPNSGLTQLSLRRYIKATSILSLQR